MDGAVLHCWSLAPPGLHVCLCLGLGRWLLLNGCLESLFCDNLFEGEEIVIVYTSRLKEMCTATNSRRPPDSREDAEPGKWGTLDWTGGFHQWTPPDRDLSRYSRIMILRWDLKVP